MINTAHLLQNGANPNGAGKNGITPLQAAAAFAKDVRIVELLLNHPDVDVNRLDNAGRNALDYAMNSAHGHGERIANLLKKKKRRGMRKSTGCDGTCSRSRHKRF
jgi:ankyrin repeat protein